MLLAPRNHHHHLAFYALKIFIFIFYISFYKMLKEMHALRMVKSSSLYPHTAAHALRHTHALWVYLGVGT